MDYAANAGSMVGIPFYDRYNARTTDERWLERDMQLTPLSEGEPVLNTPSVFLFLFRAPRPSLGPKDVPRKLSTEDMFGEPARIIKESRQAIANRPVTHEEIPTRKERNPKDSEEVKVQKPGSYKYR